MVGEPYNPNVIERLHICIDELASKVFEDSAAIDAHELIAMIDTEIRRLKIASGESIPSEVA